MKNYYAYVFFMVASLSLISVFSFPSQLFASTQKNVTFQFCPTIAAGQLDGYIFTDAKLGIYKGTSTSGKLLTTITMSGPDSNGTAGTNNCYFGYTGAGDIDNANKPILLHLEIIASPPSVTVGDVPTTYIPVDKKLPLLMVSSGDTYKFSGTLKTSAVKSTTNSKYFTPSGDGFRLFPDLSCPSGTTLTCWIKRVWKFSQGAILILSVAALVIAGVIYMTSRGNPKQIEMAKKIIIGALSAVAIMVLGNFFLTKVVGVPWL
ncbi:MAG: hypothetical protein Q8912_11705 [Bacillota bacterium]|nr:hypothetical protein [Bacillota bacterium]